MQPVLGFFSCILCLSLRISHMFGASRQINLDKWIFCHFSKNPVPQMIELFLTWIKMSTTSTLTSWSPCQRTRFAGPPRCHCYFCCRSCSCCCCWTLPPGPCCPRARPARCTGLHFALWSGNGEGPSSFASSKMMKEHHIKTTPPTPQDLGELDCIFPCAFSFSLSLSLLLIWIEGKNRRHSTCEHGSMKKVEIRKKEMTDPMTSLVYLEGFYWLRWENVAWRDQ